MLLHLQSSILNLLGRLFLKSINLFFKKQDCIYFQNSSDLAIIESLNILKQDNTHLIKGSGIDIKKFMYQPERTALLG